MVATNPDPPAGDAPPEFTGAHVKHGDPLAWYGYTNESGDHVFNVACYEVGERYLFLPWRLVNGKWLQRAGDAPRPLFGLDLYLTNFEAAILIVSDERNAAACRRILRPSVNYAMSWAGGLAGIPDTDWSPLKGRRVNILPTATEDDWKAAAKIAQRLYQLGCTVSVINTRGETPGWCLADAIQAGWTSDDVIAFAHKNKRPIELPAQPRVPMPVQAAGAAQPEAHLIIDPATEVPNFNSYSELWAYYGLELAGNRGIPWTNLDNVVRILNQHPRFQSSLWYDELRHDTVIEDDGGPRSFVEKDELDLCLWLQRAIKLHRMGQTTVRDAVNLFADKHRRHPVKDMLEACHYDGEPKLDQFLTRSTGCVDTEYTRAVSRKFLISLVARIYKPGEQVDTMLVLEGEQGDFKSRLCRLLGGPFHVEIQEKMGTKDFNQLLRGVWIIELAEMTSMIRADPDVFKSTISRPVDYFRPSYGRKEIAHPRQCVFIGTTNHYDWLTDETGGRRFWPILCVKIDLEWLAENRDSLLAEALRAYRAGEDWWTVPGAKVEQRKRYFEDPWQETVQAALVGRKEVTILTLMDILQLDIMKRTPADSRRIGRVLRHLGWYGHSTSRGGSPVKLYAPKKRDPESEQEFSDSERPPDPDEPF